MRITRSKGKSLKKKTIPLVTIEKAPASPVVPNRYKTPIKKKIQLDQTTILKNTKLSIKNRKPGYKNTYTSRPTGNSLKYIEKCEDIINSGLGNIQPKFSEQIKQLKEFKIFKDLNKVNMKLIYIMKNETGELKEKDKELQTILKKEKSTEEPSKDFYELFGIEYDEYH